MLLHLSFQTVGNFCCVTLQIKEKELMLKHDINQWYECLYYGPYSSNITDLHINPPMAKEGWGVLVQVFLRNPTGFSSFS